MQQLYPQVDARLARLDAIQEEVRRLQRAQDEARRRQLTQAALEALDALNYAPLRTTA